MFSKQYRQRYKDALKLQRWPLVDTAKMEKEKKENDRKARLRRLYGLPEDVYQATQRQYGKKIFGPYTTDDARLIQQFFGKRKGLG